MVRQGLEIQHARSVNWLKLALWLGIVFVIVAGGWYGYRYFTTGQLPFFVRAGALTANPAVDESAVNSGELASYSVAADEPRYFAIPSIGLAKTRILKTSTDGNGLLAFPANIHDVGWYQKSAKPGQGYGVVLLTGHNKGVHASGAFAKANSLAPGSLVTIELGDGAIRSYETVKTETMTVEAASQTGMKTMLEPIDQTKEGLTLVLPSGNWVPRLKQFQNRTIVHAVVKE